MIMHQHLLNIKDLLIANFMVAVFIIRVVVVTKVIIDLIQKSVTFTKRNKYLDLNNYYNNEMILRIIIKNKNMEVY